MTDTEIAQRIQNALAEYLKRDPATISPQHGLREDLGLDSMATIELLFRIEDVFDLQIPDQDLEKLVTVGDVIGYVQGRLKPATGARPVQPAAQRPPRPTKRKRGS